MTVNVYEWRENLYCEGDIVSVLTDHEPWSRWIDAGYEPGTDDVETQLTQIAQMVRVNRNNAGSVRRGDFPVRLAEPPTDPTAFCRACLHWFTLPEIETATPTTDATDGRTSVSEEGNAMQGSTMMQHADAMLAPEPPVETSIVTLITELTRIADRFKDDGVMLDAVEKLGAAITSLIEGGTGRFDKDAVIKQVKDIVRRAGGDTNGL
jgi:hypothetical protein